MILGTLVQGRERTYFDYYWNEFAADRTRSLPEADRQAYAVAYARPGRIRAGWGYFDSLPEAVKDFAQLSQTKLTMPVLSIGGEKSLGTVLGDQMKLVATDVTVIVLKNTGHWLMEESPRETTDALVKFLEGFLRRHGFRRDVASLRPLARGDAASCVSTHQRVRARSTQDASRSSESRHPWCKGQIHCRHRP